MTTKTGLGRGYATASLYPEKLAEWGAKGGRPTIEVMQARLARRRAEESRQNFNKRSLDTGGKQFFSWLDW